MRITSITVLFIAVFSVSTAFAQVRPVEGQTQSAPESPVPGNLPESVEAEYQGGIYGFSDKEKGKITFDTINERVVFRDKENKERFSIPYDAILVVYPSQKKVRSGTGRAVGAIPVPGAAIGGLFMKKKKNYLIIEYEDPEVDIKGTANFLVDTGQILESAVHAVGQNAEMSRRGDAYIRRRSL